MALSFLGGYLFSNGACFVRPMSWENIKSSKFLIQECTQGTSDGVNIEHVKPRFHHSYGVKISSFYTAGHKKQNHL